jgi:membrane glycosyltransferase
LWLALICVGLGVTAHIATVQFEYFTDQQSLFPRWPRFDSERMIALFVVAMATLMLPKILGLLRGFVTRELLLKVNPIRLVLGVIGETVLSALYAPIMMLLQTRQIVEILRGQDSGWSPQSRQRAAVARWHLLLRRHWLHMVAGLATSAGLLFLSLPLLAWMAPALLGLVLALPLSAASGSVILAKIARFFGFFTIPEEVEIPSVVRRRDEIADEIAPGLHAVTIDQLLGDEVARQRHFGAVLPRPPAQRGRPDVAYLTARAKLADARNVHEALGWLSAPERLAVLSDHDLFHVLVRLAGEHTPDRPAPALRSA